MSRLFSRQTVTPLLGTIGGFFGLLTLVACDPVAETDRYVECEAIEAKRTVILEEYTGQNCSNCPGAHRIIESLQEQYGDAFISVSIHAGKFAFDEGLYANQAPPYNYQTFKTPESEEYARQQDVTSYPSGLINRHTNVLGAFDWASTIRAEMEIPTDLKMTLNTSYNKDNNSYEISTYLTPSADYAGYLQLWLVEDSIVSLQLDGKNLLLNYVHNNVFRTSLNGVGGEVVDLQRNVITHNTQIYHPANGSPYDERHLKVVAFYYDESGVVQAAKCKLSNESGDNQK